MLSAADVTARIVASHAAIGQVSRRRMLPREIPPDVIEAEYATRLLVEVQEWRDAIAPLLAATAAVLAIAVSLAIAIAYQLHVRSRSRALPIAFAVAVAAAAVAATGGSTNAVLHLLAVAHEAEIPLVIDDFDRVSVRTPLLADLKPGGRFTAVDLHRAGGVRLVARRLQDAGVLHRWNPNHTSRKGQGFEQPLRPHEHWHIDITYINVAGTFYYLCMLLDGYSRSIVHWDLRESMTEPEVEIMIFALTGRSGPWPASLRSALARAGSNR